MTTNQPKVTDKPGVREAMMPEQTKHDLANVSDFAGAARFALFSSSETNLFQRNFGLRLIDALTAQAAALVAAEANAWPFGKRPNPVCGHTQGEFAVYGDEASIKKVRAAIHELDVMMSHRIERIKHEQSLRETAETEVATLKARIAELIPSSLNARIRDLDEAESVIGRVKGVMGGEPVFKGTRIPVRTVAAMLAQGADEADLLDGYPSLTARMIELAKIWTAAHPTRGRPKKLSDRGLKVKSSKRTTLKGDPRMRKSPTKG